MRPVGEILMSVMDSASHGQTILELLCQDACHRLPISGAGLCLMTGDGLGQLTVASDDRTRELQELEFVLGGGPSKEALESGRLVLHTDLSTQRSELWPHYCHKAYGLGVRGVFSYPVRIGQIHLGVLGLYRDRPGHFDDGDLSLSLDYAEAAALILLHIQAHDESKRSLNGNSELRQTQVESTFHDYPEMHQATGMISVQAGVGLPDALLLLRARAFATGRALPDLAHEVVTRRLSFKDSGGPGR